MNIERARPLERIGEEGEWSQVRIEDGTEGWIKTERIVVDDTVRIATVVAESKRFKRPELLALVIGEKVPAGAILIAAKTDGKFTEIDVQTDKYASERTWVLTEDLVFDPNMIEAAKIIDRVMQLREKDKDGAAQLEELARSQFAGSPLLALLDVVEEPEPAPEEGEEVAGED